MKDRHVVDVLKQLIVAAPHAEHFCGDSIHLNFMIVRFAEDLVDTLVGMKLESIDAIDIAKPIQSERSRGQYRDCRVDDFADVGRWRVALRAECPESPT